MKLGIDMHNVRNGGGVSYVSNILRMFDPEKHGFSRVCVFGSEEVLSHLPDGPNIEKHPQAILSRNLLFRLFFVFFLLGGELRRTGCSLLYSPGGLYFGRIRPFATISRNMMPFEPEHWGMYPTFSFDRLRLHLMRRVHTMTFRRADGMVFLTTIAERIVGAAMGVARGRTAVIAHGVNRKLFHRGDDSPPLPASLDPKGPIRLVYPSRLEPYKHQVQVIEAVKALRGEFPQLTIDLCGPANPDYKVIVDAALEASGLGSDVIRYHGELPLAALPPLYGQSHLLVFASSCENLPNTLIEALCFGIPIVSSRRPPMPEVAQDACLYFDPADSRSIVQAIRAALMDWPAALERVRIGQALADRYSWETCAEQTFGFLRGLLPPAATH